MCAATFDFKTLTLIHLCLIHVLHLLSLKIQKEKLDTINSVQGLSLDELENQLKESKKILDKMELNLQGDILGNLMDIALACDEDGDFELSDDEIEDVITQLEELNGVDIDNDRLRNVLIERGRSVEGEQGTEIFFDGQYSCFVLIFRRGKAIDFWSKWYLTRVFCFLYLLVLQSTGIMDVIKNLLRDDIPEEENLFHFISK